MTDIRTLIRHYAPSVKLRGAAPNDLACSTVCPPPVGHQGIKRGLSVVYGSTSIMTKYGPILDYFWTDLGLIGSQSTAPDRVSRTESVRYSRFYRCFTVLLPECT